MISKDIVIKFYFILKEIYSNEIFVAAIRMFFATWRRESFTFKRFDEQKDFDADSEDTISRTVN